jgi:hypothetical protein
VDRLLINLVLDVSSDFTDRATYVGRQNISQFDLSFRIQRQRPSPGAALIGGVVGGMAGGILLLVLGTILLYSGKQGTTE